MPASSAASPSPLKELAFDHAHRDFAHVRIEHKVAKALAAILLAFFIPVVLALAENVSIQAMTLTLSAQHSGRPTWSSVGAALSRELPLGILLGTGCGSLVFLAAWAWHQQLLAAFCIFAGILLSVTTATVLGLVVPSATLALKRDPQSPRDRSRSPLPISR
jgi:Mg/Co/Ni transporter MgtE